MSEARQTASSPSQSGDADSEKTTGASDSALTPSDPAPHQGRSVRESSVSQSFTSDDSQAVLLNHPSPSESPFPSDKKPKEVLQESSTTVKQGEEEVAKCWICFADETEDTPTSSEWRSPCPCALKAHEECLLDWVANTDRTKSRNKGKIECPQCKGEIRMSEPRHLVAGIHQKLSSLGLNAVLPATGAALAGSVIAGLFLHGFGTVFVVLGYQSAGRILGLNAAAEYGFFEPRTLATGLIPINMLLSQLQPVDTLETVIAYSYVAWDYAQTGSFVPRSLWMTMCQVHLVRMSYDMLYKLSARSWEIRWLHELYSNHAVEDGNGEAGIDGGADRDIEVDVQVEIGVNAPPPVQLPQEQQDAHRDEGNAANNPAPAPGPNANGHPNLNANNQGMQVINVPASAFLQRPIMTLCSPFISALVGKALEYVLPHSWITSPGLLRSHYGRTLVGGCLFFFLKDSLRIVATYQRVQARRQRRILNNVKELK